MQETSPTRQELRATFANLESSQAQLLEAKLILAKRIANGTKHVRQICEDYRLPPEQAAQLITNHENIIGDLEAKAAEEVQRLEQSLIELRKE